MYGRPPVDHLARRLRTEGAAKILFLSNHGAARALIAESIVNRYRASGFSAISAGVSPEGTPHPMAAELLRAYRLPAPRSRPISFDEALDTEAQNVDFVVALWDRSCGEPFPAPYRDRLAASWDVPDPRRPHIGGAGIIGSRMGFVRAYLGLRQRIDRFFTDVARENRAEPAGTLDLDEIGTAPNGLLHGPNIQPRKSASSRRGWSLGGVFGRRSAKGVDSTEPLSLGRAQLVRDQRRS